MNHTSSSNAPWLNAWLESQRDWLQRWQAAAAAPRADGMSMDADMLRKYFSADGLPDAMNAAHSFQTLLQSGMAQFTAHAGSATDASAMWPDIGQQISQAFAIGPAREHQQAWREYTQAMLDYQQRQQAVLQAYGNVLAQALEAVRLKIEQQHATGKPVTGLRELYELWVECGEQAFAALAHEPPFIAAQAASANALSRVQLARNALLEKWLRTHDLPTRSELNSVHLRLRELSARVAQLEQLGGTQRKAAPAQPRRRKPASKA